MTPCPQCNSPDECGCVSRDVWIDQNADKARLVASGWWPRVVPARVPVDSDETGGEG